MTSPSVQILIPTYNRANYLHRAIGSCLSQSYGNLQILISDNASSDSTQSVCDSYAKSFPGKIKYFRNDKNVGMTANWVRLLYEHSDSDYCLLLSDDDELIDCNYISKVVNAFVESKGNISLVFGNTLLLDESNKNESRCSIISHDWPKLINFNQLMRGWRQGSKSSFGNHIILSGAVFDRKLALDVDAFKSGLLSADFELWWSLLSRGTSACYLNTVASSYAIHNSNEATRTKYNFEDWIRNYNCYLSPLRHLPPSVRLHYRHHLLRILSKSLIDFCGTELQLFRFKNFLTKATAADPEVSHMLSRVLYSYRIIFFASILNSPSY